MAIILLKMMTAIIVITSCNIMLLSGYGEALLARVAGGGTRNTSLGKYCKILEEIFSQARFECNLEMSAKFRPHPDPSPVRIVLTWTTFFLIQTPFFLTTT
ncbi:MAG: hypothetical protein A2V67_10855 [Deltaproteobacteria bacterium RBG_13_61_14]|nr:MAG: hypothetical protein A2V67_10855 [Deltaproteobacteria bacterium RBG_13_61_14]